MRDLVFLPGVPVQGIPVEAAYGTEGLGLLVSSVPE